jgi:hypothetical protein
VSLRGMCFYRFGKSQEIHPPERVPLTRPSGTLSRKGRGAGDEGNTASLVGSDFFVSLIAGVSGATV